MFINTKPEDAYFVCSERIKQTNNNNYSDVSAKIREVKNVVAVSATKIYHRVTRQWFLLVLLR